MKKILIGLVAAGVLSLNAGSLYDMLSVDTGDTSEVVEIISSECVRPIKLKEINDNRDAHRYNDELNTYSACINIFVRETTKILDSTEDEQEKKIYIKSIANANAALHSYDTTEDVEQNQMHHSTFEFDGLGCEKDKLKKK